MGRQAKPIELSMSIQDVIVRMSEGNPGAITVMTEIIGADPLNGFFKILDLDDMNMRGEQIWVAFKDHCGSDIQKLLDALQDRNPEMVDTVNKQCSARHVAVKHGASNRDFIR